MHNFHDIKTLKTETPQAGQESMDGEGSALDEEKRDKPKGRDEESEVFEVEEVGYFHWYAPMESRGARSQMRD
ncbi:unnamed protein product [Ilex paraguariensis]|uniref:Uncharacterized protein n=1 Tax=Ilex paraguariensis TaxID=185542 RepID=A0ABC8RE37_9AQUA